MCYRFQNSAESRGEFLRIAREQVAQALAELSSKISTEEKVHNVRRCLKRARSLLKFIRPHVPSEFYTTENQRLRDLGRNLASVRDLSVSLQAFDDLKLPAALRVPLGMVISGGKTRIEGLGKMRTELQRALKEVDLWPVDSVSGDDLAESLVKVYKGARKAFKRAKKQPLPQEFHRWRQRVKVLEHSYRLIEPFCPKSLQKKAKKSDKLSDVLGELHDLAVLSEHLGKTETSPAVRKKALGIVSRRSRKLETRAFKLGQKVFDSNTQAFRRKYHFLLTSNKANHD